jgi:hypothetical protein
MKTDVSRTSIRGREADVLPHSTIRVKTQAAGMFYGACRKGECDREICLARN